MITMNNLVFLYEEVERLDEELQALSDRVFDAGLEETSTSLAMDDAMKALGRASADLGRRIEFAKEEE